MHLVGHAGDANSIAGLKRPLHGVVRGNRDAEPQTVIACSQGTGGCLCMSGRVQPCWMRVLHACNK